MTPRWTQAKMTEVATEERSELGLAPLDPLDPYQLCEAHGIDVYPIDELQDSQCGPEVIEHFTVHKTSSWSAALLPIGTARVIIENTAHKLVRRRSSIAHELGHHLLEHEFATVLLGEEKCRNFDATQEKQALFISGELLVPDEACKKMAFKAWSNAQVSTRFGVSEQFGQMRMTGARVMAGRALRKQARGRA